MARRRQVTPRAMGPIKAIQKQPTTSLWLMVGGAVIGLFVAAPNLLSILEKLESHARFYGGVPWSANKLWIEVIEAIAKAKGE